MLNELNKAATLPGYEHYLHEGAGMPGGPMGGMGGPEHAGYDIEDAWNNDRYYTGAASGQRYKV